MRCLYGVLRMKSSSQWLGPRSPVIPAKRYTSDSPTVLRIVAFLPTCSAANASLAADVIVPLSLLSARPAEELAADDDALDLARPFPDGVQARVAVEPLDHRLRRVAGRA